MCFKENVFQRKCVSILLIVINNITINKMTQTKIIKAMRLPKKNIKVKKNDVLMVIDMQNDFIDRPYTDRRKRFKTGKLPTWGSKSIVKPIARLTSKFLKKATIVATRDYHPVKNPHCSFSIFGEHCAWKTAGSDIAKEINDVIMTKTKKKTETPKKNCHIVFKGFSSKIDSFGAFPYTKKLGLKRICGCTRKSCPVGFTGSYSLKKYVKYPTLKTSGKAWRKSLIPLKTVIKSTNKKTNTIFICGVLGDFCVLDTARNARNAGYKNVYIVIDLIRSLRIKEKGKVIYPTTSKLWIKLAKKHGFKFIMSKNIKI